MKKIRLFITASTLTLITIVTVVLLNYEDDFDQKSFSHATFLLRQEMLKPNYSIILSRNEERWLRLQEKFKPLNFDLLFSPEAEQNRKNKTIIYKCDSYCGGLGDRLRGIVTSYFLALVSGRQFFIDMKYPCDITNFLQPNLYHWILNLNKATFNRSTRRIIALDTNDEIVQEIRDTPFIRNWSQYGDIEIYTNMDFVTTVFLNPWLRQNQIIQMFSGIMSPGEANINTLFPLLFEILFRPSIQVTNVIDSVLATISQRGNSLLCLHIRIGQNPTNPNDAIFGDRETIAKDMIEFIDDSTLLQIHNLTVMVASDSNKAVLQILRHFEKRSFTVPGPILHIDRPANHIDRCEGFLKVVVDFYILGECHTSLVTNSRFSAFANRRRKDPYQNFYKYDSKEKRMRHCENIFLTSRWESSQSVNITVYCPATFKSSIKQATQ